MNKKRFNLEREVLYILTLNPKARDDDFELVAEIYYRICPDILKLKFNHVILGHKELCLPSFESISRARRKVQAENPDLCSIKTKQRRNKLEKEYRNYYSNYNDYLERGCSYE